MWHIHALMLGIDIPKIRAKSAAWDQNGISLTRSRWKRSRRAARCLVWMLEHFSLRKCGRKKSKKGEKSMAETILCMHIAISSFTRSWVLSAKTWSSEDKNEKAIVWQNTSWNAKQKQLISAMHQKREEKHPIALFSLCGITSTWHSSFQGLPNSA